jgi:hypothetical protein
MTGRSEFEFGSRDPFIFSAASGQVAGDRRPAADSRTSASLEQAPLTPERKSVTQRSPRDLAGEILAGGSGPHHGRLELAPHRISLGCTGRLVRAPDIETTVGVGRNGALSS